MEQKRATVIRRKLNEYGVPERDFAQLVGISKSYLCDIFYGRRSGEPVRLRIERALAELEQERREQAAEPVELRVRHL